MATQHWHLGFDIGGTKCAVVLGCTRAADSRPVIVEKEVFRTRRSAAEVLSAMAALARELLARRQLTPACVQSGGISCGGPLDSARGLVLSPPNLPGWDAVPVTEILGKALGVALWLQNDANACALAEWRWGAAHGADTAVFLTFGTGLGAGLIIGGRLYEGRSGLAGEVGHWRLAPDGPTGYGKAGSFEGFCSGGGMERLARSLAHSRGREYPGESAAVRELAPAARAGEPLALEVFDIAGTMLGRGLAQIVDLLNPDVIVIGSIFARCEDLLRPAMERELQAEALPQALGACRIVPAALGERIGDYAALAAGGV